MHVLAVITASKQHGWTSVYAGLALRLLFCTRREKTLWERDYVHTHMQLSRVYFMSTLDVTHMTNCTRLSPSLMGREPGNEVIDWLVQHYHTGCFGEPKPFAFTSVDFQQSTHGVAILVWERTAIQVQDNVNHSNNNSSMGINWSTTSNSSTGYLTRQGDSQYTKTSGYHTNSKSL